MINNSGIFIDKDSRFLQILICHHFVCFYAFNLKIKAQSGTVKAFIRREGKKVYALLDKENNCFDEKLLYDFDLKVGESTLITTQYTGGEEYFYDLLKIEKVTFFGKIRQKYIFEVRNMQNKLVGQKVWIEGIGSLVHPFETLIKPVFDGYWYELLCSYSNQQQHYMNPKYNFCNTTAPTNDIFLENIDVQISPNPFHNNLTINILDEANDDFTMVLYNNIGQEVLRQSVAPQTSVDVAALAQGTYFVKIMNKDKSKSVVRRVVKL